MQTYILCSNLTAEGARTMHTNPDRVFEVDREVEEFGCKLVAQYATLGRYDFVTIVEAPDNETIANLSITVSARGAVDIVTMPAMPIEGLTATLKKIKGPQPKTPVGLKKTA